VHARVGPELREAGRAALVLGAGGSARAVAWALARAGAREVMVWNRTPERARALAADLGVEAVAAPRRADVVVNCTSVGLQKGDDPFKTLPVAADDWGAGTLVVDMVYRDGGSLLLSAARERGAEVADGLDVLVAQGAAAFERWTGRTASRQAMRAAVKPIAP
jgi:shikimate dehydrogenase